MSSLNHRNLPNNSVVCLIAPTASGKTDLAFKLFDTGRFELISVDSALIYTDMNIGTAKPTPTELANHPHHLVDIITPMQTYSVANFVADCTRLIEQIHQNGKIPLLVGGTMMYYMALLDGISSVPETDGSIRQKVANWLKTDGIDPLYQYLKTHDPAICERLKASDTQRITRAVEVHLQTSTPMSVWQATPKIAACHNPKQNWTTLSVEPQRAWLHERIAKRLDIMWEQGLVAEVINLLQKYPNLTPDMPSMRCVGYRQAVEFLGIIGHQVMQNNAELSQFSQSLQANMPAHERDFLRDFQADEAEFDKNLANLLDNQSDFSKNLQKEPLKYLQMACQDMKNKALYATRQLAKRQSTWQRSLARLNGMPHTSLIIPFSSIQEVEQQLL